MMWRPHVCLITINKEVDKQLGLLKHSGDKVDVEDKLKKLATEANTTQSGALDTPDCLLHGEGWSGNLADVRRKRVGRHRVFFVGHHTRCSYRTLYIKMYKKTGVEDENDPALQEKIKGLLGKPLTRILNPEKPPDPSAT
ncbi:MAG: hypothetical protein ACR2G4_02140 [Pyrinomonadaceae bacterium]